MNRILTFLILCVLSFNISAHDSKWYIHIKDISLFDIPCTRGMNTYGEVEEFSDDDTTFMFFKVYKENSIRLDYWIDHNGLKKRQIFSSTEQVGTALGTFELYFMVNFKEITDNNIGDRLKTAFYHLIELHDGTPYKKDTF